MADELLKQYQGMRRDWVCEEESWSTPSLKPKEELGF